MCQAKNIKFNSMQKFGIPRLQSIRMYELLSFHLTRRWTWHRMSTLNVLNVNELNLIETIYQHCTPTARSRALIDDCSITCDTNGSQHNYIYILKNRCSNNVISYQYYSIINKIICHKLAKRLQKLKFLFLICGEGFFHIIIIIFMNGSI